MDYHFWWSTVSETAVINENGRERNCLTILLLARLSLVPCSGCLCERNWSLSMKIKIHAEKLRRKTPGEVYNGMLQQSNLKQTPLVQDFTIQLKWQCTTAAYDVRKSSCFHVSTNNFATKISSTIKGVINFNIMFDLQARKTF